MENRVKFEISTSTILKVVLAIFLVWFIYSIREIVVLFLIVLVIVAALAPVVNRMSKYMPRVLAMILLFMIFLAILTIIGFIIIPPIVEQIQNLSINLPVIASRFGPFYENFQNSITNYQEGLFNASSQIGRLTQGIYSTTVGFISGVVAIFTILVLSFYMLLEQALIKKYIVAIVPTEHQDRIFITLRKIGLKMGDWLRGQGLLMVIIGILDGIALFVLGIPYALTLAVWGGLTEVIPYIGPWLGLIPVFIIAFTISPLKAVLVLAAYLIIQQLESQFLAPKIMGKAVGLSPVIIIMALLIGAKLMGILGVLLAVPAAAVLAVVIQEWPELKKLKNENAG